MFILDNDKRIVESIKKGIDTSSHLLCLVSDKTKLSWWVPYEVGVACERGKKIATLKLKGIEDIPSFLKTEEVLRTIQEFFDYTKTLEPYEGSFSKRELGQDDKVKLYKYIDF